MDGDLSRLRGRALLNKLNEQLICSLFLLGVLFSGIVFSFIGLIYSPTFILLIVPFLYFSYKITKHARKVSDIKKDLGDTLYAHDDKSYVWQVENTRDKLMARLIQEGICPWNDNKCNHKPCFCKRQTEHFKSLGLDTEAKEKIKLDERDANTWGTLLQCKRKY